MSPTSAEMDDLRFRALCRDWLAHATQAGLLHLTVPRWAFQRLLEQAEAPDVN